MLKKCWECLSCTPRRLSKAAWRGFEDCYAASKRECEAPGSRVHARLYQNAHCSRFNAAFHSKSETCRSHLGGCYYFPRLPAVQTGGVLFILFFSSRSIQHQSCPCSRRSLALSRRDWLGLFAPPPPLHPLPPHTSLRFTLRKEVYFRIRPDGVRVGCALSFLQLCYRCRAQMMHMHKCICICFRRGFELNIV